MNTFNRTFLLTGTLWLGSLAAFGAGAAQSALEMGQVDRTTATAASFEDHERLAARYADEARSLRARAAHHIVKARVYDTLAGGSTKGGHVAFAGHSRKLAVMYEKAANEYTQLMTLHQQFAAELAKKTGGSTAERRNPKTGEST
jgi:hypothetical protein